MIYDLSCRVYCTAHRLAKSLLRQGSQQFRMVDIDPGDVPESELGNFFPVENIMYGEVKNGRPSFETLAEKCSLGVSSDKVAEEWRAFIASSTIPQGYKNAGLCYAGYIDRLGWCLPSWIWTNASLVRATLLSPLKAEDKGRGVADLLLGLQEECGGWIVRNDYGVADVVPVLAPNDSSYIANNAMLTMYCETKEEKYLEAAQRCADWVISVARPDGMVPVGFDMRKLVWQKHNIVDTGFTAALFARLYEITGEIKFKDFLIRFTEAYIRLFYNESTGGFATSLDANDRQLGGMFARGQAWALEGLIPAYRVLKDERIRSVIVQTIQNLLRTQRKTGGWAYNLTRPLMGLDCKGIPVIAKALLEWNKVAPNIALVDAAKRALVWCEAHTCMNGPARGGIFSFCMEGAVVHHSYTSTAFVYASVYALEVQTMLKNV